VTRAARERLRRSYLPERVGVLFVGESPPAGGTFFYSADSELYRATREVFTRVFPECCGEGTFLAWFALRGCYLVDLSLDPVNQLTNREDGSRPMRLLRGRQGEARLAKTIAALRPLAIVVLLKAIVPNVSRAMLAAETLAERFDLTYPSRWHNHRLAYRRELASVLRKLERRGTL
jgi:hypothetical protein